MPKGKQFITICWLCRDIWTMLGIKQAEEIADTHAVKKHKRAAWESFMECQSVESLVKERDISKEN